MKVSELMTRDVRTCGIHANLAVVTEILWRTDCGIVPVLDEEGALAGVVTDRDVAIALGTREARPYEVFVKDVLSRRVHACHATDEVEDALDVMSSAKVRRLPVVDDRGRLIGMFTMNDAILATARRPGLPGDRVLAALRAISAHRAPETASARA